MSNNRTERASAGSISIYRRFMSIIDPALPRSVLLILAICISAQAQITEKATLRTYIETGKYAEAEATARKSLQKTPDSGPIRHELAETLAITGRYTEAITEFERAAAES